jgi:hypothetical protein
LTRRFNIPDDQLGPVLASLVPAAVDHASPDGKMPHTAPEAVPAVCCDKAAGSSEGTLRFPVLSH